MKKTIKKKKAFTLVELMGVLVILGVLTAILIPVISNALKENKEKAYQSQLQNIILSAKNFASDNMFLLPENEGDSIYITLGQLKKSGYSENSIINPKTKEEISNCLKITITKKNNNYDYMIDENTIEDESCNEEFNSDVSLTGPSKEYIKKGDVSSYILIMKPTEDSQVLSYSLDDSKLSLGDNVVSKYSVVGDNGIYKILIMAGETEEDVLLTFNDGAIKDSNDNNINIDPLSKTIKVDNTAPVITFTNNGSSAWTKEAKTKINVNDEKSGGDDSTYRYIYSNITSAEPSQSFSTNNEVTHTTGNGQYYLIASACDKAGNCNKNTSNAFNMDTAGPVIMNIDNPHNDEWVKEGYYVYMDVEDEGVGEIKTYWSDNGTAYYEETNTSGDRNYINFTQERNNTVYLKACDALNNCSTPQTTIVKIDYTAPVMTIENSHDDEWVNQSYNVYMDITETGSGEIKTYWSDNETSYYEETNISGGRNYINFTQERNNTIYLKACDALNNCSTPQTTIVKIDKQKPSINSASITNAVNNNNEKVKQVTLNVTDNLSGVQKVTEGTYKHTAGGAEGNLIDWNAGWWHQFKYAGSSTNILYINNIVAVDAAGNRSDAVSFTCTYSNNTCTKK